MLGKLRAFYVGHRVLLFKSWDHIKSINRFNLKGLVTSTTLACENEMKRTWNAPSGESELKIYNSLTKEKVKIAIGRICIKVNTPSEAQSSLVTGGLVDKIN